MNGNNSSSLEKSRYERLRQWLVEKLVREGIIKSERVRKAMLRVPRELFVPDEYKPYSYEDTPLPIGYGQTISAPHMVALMCEEAMLKEGMKVLEVGTGSGYHAAVIAEIVAPKEARRKGHVYTIERIPELARFARENLRKAGYLDRVTVIVGDGSLGFKEAAPYDRIIVTAASPDIPRPLFEQLKHKGRMVIPIGDRYWQHLYVVIKKCDGSMEVIRRTPCLFVPLIGKYGFKDTNNQY